MIRRLGRAALLELAESLSARDRQIIETVVRLRLVSGKQLERLFFADVRRPASRARLARRSCHRLVAAGVLGRLERRVGGVRAGSAGYIYFDAPAAQRLIAYWQGEGRPQRPRAPYEPGRAFVRHRLGISECFVRLTEAERHGRLGLADFESEPVVTFFGFGGTRLVLRPDALVRLYLGSEIELHAYLEIDCGTEGRAALARKCDAYIAAWRSGSNGTVFPRVVWITTTERRAAVLREICGSLPPETWKLFLITSHEHTLDALVTVPGGAA